MNSSLNTSASAFSTRQNFCAITSRTRMIYGPRAGRSSFSGKRDSSTAFPTLSFTKNAALFLTSTAFRIAELNLLIAYMRHMQKLSTTIPPARLTTSLRSPTSTLRSTGSVTSITSNFTGNSPTSRPPPSTPTRIFQSGRRGSTITSSSKSSAPRLATTATAKRPSCGS